MPRVRNRDIYDLTHNCLFFNPCSTILCHANESTMITGFWIRDREISPNLAQGLIVEYDMMVPHQ